MTHTDNTTIARLDGKTVSFILRLGAGVPEIAYYGPKLPVSIENDSILSLGQPARMHGALDMRECLSLVPETGTGFSAHPGISVYRDTHTFISQMVLQGVEKTAAGLSISLHEPQSDFSLDIAICIDPDSDVASCSANLRNTGTTPLHVDWLASVTLPLPPGHEHISLFDGRWAGEYQWRTQQLTTGSLRKENRLGRTAHNSLPAMVISQGEPQWTRGAAIALQLGWSGNHRLLADRTRDGRLYAQLGELLQPREIILAPQACYTTPTAYLTVSGDGMNSLMHQHHGFVRDQLLRAPYRNLPRPVHFNTWEACYFDQSEARSLELVDAAAAIGAERFVLDDGWFKGRHDDTAGLGDWDVCEQKYPRGLTPVINAVKGHGMTFGLWIEPEMVNADSDLARAHPDWLLGEPGRTQPLGRNQHVLNLAVPEVFEHLLATISGLIRRHDLGYLKWDMNRDLTHAAIGGQPAFHRIMQASYQLLAAVNARHPDTEIEICASGGARADYGALAHGSRIWTSDVHDPHVRQPLQRSFSLFFPPEVMGAHVGGRKDEITGRVQSMMWRTASPMVGHYGIEMDPATLDDRERATLMHALAFYKQHRDWLHRACSYFIDHSEACIIPRLAVSADQQTALLVIAQIDECQQATPAPVRLPGLAPGYHYQVTRLRRSDYSPADTMTVAAQTLAHIGLNIPLMRPESAILFILKATAASDSAVTTD